MPTSKRRAAGGWGWGAAKRTDLGGLVECDTPFMSRAVGCITVSVPRPHPPQVKVTMGKFEERLWSIIRNFVAVSQEEPGLLVTALQVCTGGGRRRGGAAWQGADGRRAGSKAGALVSPAQRGCVLAGGNFLWLH